MKKAKILAKKNKTNAIKDNLTSNESYLGM